MRAAFSSLIASLTGLSVCHLQAAPQPAELGDEQLRLTLRQDAGRWMEFCEVEGRPLLALRSELGWAWIGEGETNVVRPQPDRVQMDGDGLTVQGADERLGWTFTYKKSGRGRMTKSLTLHPKSDLRLQRLALWTTEGATARVARTELQDIAAFYREDQRGLFVSLDFPYSRITQEGGAVSVTYPPFQMLPAGQDYTAHSLTVGAVRLSNVERYGWDTGEVEAMDRYVQERFAPRFQRPMFVSCSIVNRYTQVSGDIIFYTQKDHPSLWMNQDLLRREIALMPRLGMEYYQVFPGVFDWGPDDPRPAEVQDLVAFSRQQGVRLGDYSGASVLFCAHYAEYRNRLDRPQWQTRAADGRLQGTYCFGHPEFVAFYSDKVAANCRRFGFELHCLDFLSLGPCYAEDHGHPPGQDSLYHQVRGLTKLLEAINGVSPETMTWSNSGNWAGLLPKLAWSNPNLYLTDPFIATPWQGLNMTRLLDDARREQMVSLHYSRFIPYRFLSNCQYFFSQNSISPDLRNYQYGALSTLAVTPNLCLGEIRPWIDRLPAADQEGVLRFYKTWTDFITRNFDLWTNTYHAGENPGPGAVEIYAHARADHGFVFLVNPQYWDREVNVPLDPQLGFSGSALVELRELHPVSRLRLVQGRPFVRLGDAVSLRVPAQQVVVLEVRPAAPAFENARLFGLPGTVDSTPAGYLIKTTGLQGTREEAALLVPGNHPPVMAVRVRPDVPKQPKRQWAATSVVLEPATNQTGLTRFHVQFRRDAAPTELREWQVRSGSLAAGIATHWPAGFQGESLRFPLFVDCQPAVPLPLSDGAADCLGLGTLANFCGAYVENAFSESQETWIELLTAAERATTKQPPASDPTPAGPVPSAGGPCPIRAPAPLSELAKDRASSWWLQTRFHLPFMYMIGAEPFFDEHTWLVLPFIRQSKIRNLRAWINGQPLDVQTYRYPRNRALATFYADLVGTGARGGDNTLVVHFETQPE